MEVKEERIRHKGEALIYLSISKLYGIREFYVKRRPLCPVHDWYILYKIRGSSKICINANNFKKEDMKI
ncbi:MAG: hypothetical protein ACYCSO_05095 [Cuniculiplasma sp.]